MDRVLLISADSHGAASWEDYLPYFDPHRRPDWMAEIERRRHYGRGHVRAEFDESVQWDSDLRRVLLEREGVVAEVVFPNRVPFDPGVGVPWTAIDLDCQADGRCAYNRWLADFCAELPGRRAGMCLISLHDVDAAVAQLRWAKAAGLAGVDLPQDRGQPHYVDPALEPIWCVAEELDLTLAMHSAPSVDWTLATGFAGTMLALNDYFWWTARAVNQLIAAGVLDRHPNLRIAITEAGADWVPGMRESIDWLATAPEDEWPSRQPIGRTASDYWLERVWLTGPISRVEIELRHEIGLDRIAFGTDFPHFEGTSPNTAAWIRATMGSSGVTGPELRRMCGWNALDCYPRAFDVELLKDLAARLGPLEGELLAPATSDDLAEVDWRATTSRDDEADPPRRIGSQ